MIEQMKHLTPAPIGIAGDAFYWYRFKFTKNYDGDTIDGDIDLGFGIKWSIRLRLYGVNCPEKKKPTLVEGNAAQQYTQRLVSAASEAGVLFVRTHRDEADKYGGRWLAEVFLPVTVPMTESGNVDLKSARFDANGEWVNLSGLLIASGHAVPYLV